jgi:hypothetical protein
MGDYARTVSVRRARIAWITVAAVTTAVWFGGPISQWARLHTICHPDSACRSFQLDTTAADTLSRYAISVSTFALSMLAIQVVLWVLWFGVAALIIRRKADDRGALLTAFFLVILPAWSVSTWAPSSAVSNAVTSVFVALLLIFCLLFPDGRFEPPWTRRLAVGVIVLDITSNLPVPGVVSFVSILVIPAVLVVPIYRYRRLSTWAQRQQTKWAVSGLALAIAGWVAVQLVFLLGPFPPSNGSLFSAIIIFVGDAVVVSAIPICIGISVLRSRLWDIDHVINRAIVYSSLTVVVAGLYVGGILGLQALFDLIVGGGSALAIAISTLAIAALFSPLRRRIQLGIDRRFYRSKYDAERTLAAFGEQVRDEVDLAQISHGLTSVIRETLQPEHVSLWLRFGGGSMNDPARNRSARLVKERDDGSAMTTHTRGALQ